MNIPILRAKKIDSNEYVMGWYSSPIIIEGKIYLSIINQDGEYRIDTTTLSIHFPDMLDSQGNEIFASLQKDGRGGDIVNCYLGKNQIPTREKQIVKYYKPYHMGLASYDLDAYSKLEVIGIQE